MGRMGFRFADSRKQRVCVQLPEQYRSPATGTSLLRDGMCGPLVGCGAVNKRRGVSLLLFTGSPEQAAASRVYAFGEIDPVLTGSEAVYREQQYGLFDTARVFLAPLCLARSRWLLPTA